MDLRHRNFVEPPWEAPLDVAAVLRAIPESAAIAGMFLEAQAEEARKQHRPLPSARERYVPFRFYPLREHAQLLVEMCELHFAKFTLRQALRKLGRAAPSALVSSTIGKSMLTPNASMECLLRVLVTTFPLNCPPGKLELVEISSSSAIVHLEDVYHFIDSHQIGMFEGLMRFAGKRGRVSICAYSGSSADYLCSWS